MNSLTNIDKTKIIEGNNEPLGRVFESHFTYCTEILGSMSNCSPHEAEDTFMDAIQVLRDKVISKDFQHTNLRGFLIVTAKNKLRNKLKRDRKTIDLEVDAVERYLHKKRTTMDGLASNLSTEQERKVDFILKARHELGPSCQKLLEMNFDLGYKLKELVEILGFSNYDSIKSTKSRCMRTLKSKVATLMQQHQK